MAMHELAYREDGGIEVALIWDEARNALTVCVWDAQSGHFFELPAEPERALDVFRHPYSYAATTGVQGDRAYLEAA